MMMNEIKNDKVFLLIILSSFIFASCSYFSPKDEKKDLKLLKKEEWSKNLLTNMKDMCLQGEGRGTYLEKEESYTFNYESLFDLENKVWKTVLYAPLHGEETFFVHYKENFSRVEGTLVSKFKKDEMIDEFYNKLASFLSVMNDVNFSTHIDTLELEKRCSLSKRISKDSFNLSGFCKWSNTLKFEFDMNSRQLFLKFPLSHRYVLEIQNDQLHEYEEAGKNKKSYFEQTRLVLKKKRIIPNTKKDGIGPFLDNQSELFSLEFKASSCQVSLEK